MKRVEERTNAKPKAKRASRASWARRPAAKDVRYIDIHEGDEFDEAQMANWVKQAAALPGFLGP
jgi:hypothetical protein